MMQRLGAFDELSGHDLDGSPSAGGRSDDGRSGDRLEDRSGAALDLRIDQAQSPAAGPGSGSRSASRGESRGVMEFDMGGGRSDAASRRKADAFLERSRQRADEAKAKARADALRSQAAAEAAEAEQERQRHQWSSPGFGGARLVAGAALEEGSLAARLAAGGSAGKVPMAEAKARSARLWQALPEVAGQRRKEAEFAERLGRISKAKADDRSRRLASAEKQKQAGRTQRA